MSAARRCGLSLRGAEREMAGARRRLVVELLEDRRLLSIGWPTSQLPVAPIEPAGVERASLTWPGEFIPSQGPAQPSEPVDPPANAWQTVFSDGFEGAFPGSWSVSGNPTWGDSSYTAHTGSWSAYCVDSGIAAPGPYPNNTNAWMVYGPFSLADATDAKVDFWYRNKSEVDYDWFSWTASTNGTNYYGAKVSGDANTWRSQTFDLKNVYTLGNLCGQSQVWIAFIFQSDVSNTDIGTF